MVFFQDIEDVEEWLEPLDYLSFWEAVAGYPIFTIADRDHCDGLIAGGTVKPETILKGLKGIAVLKLREGMNLHYRRHETHTSQGIKSLH